MICKESPGAFLVICDRCGLSYVEVKADDIPAAARILDEQGWLIKPAEQICGACR